MKNLFPGYQRKTPAQFEALWKSSTICFDTSVLLELYRYSPKTREKVLELMQGFSDRVYLPFQVVKEYQKNRLNRIVDQRKIYKDFEKAYSEFLKGIKSESSHPYFSDNLVRKAENLGSKIAEECKTSEKLIAKQLDHDLVFEKLSAIFEGKIGADFEDYQSVNNDAERRFKANIPPGYKDKDKLDGGFGDFYIWRQIIEIAKAKGTSVILVTNETKVDWWWYSGNIENDSGDRFGPRPELVNEFVKEAGHDFHLYSLIAFTQYSEKALSNKEVDSDVLRELKDSEIDKLREHRFKYDGKHRYDGTTQYRNRHPLKKLAKPDEPVPSIYRISMNSFADKFKILQEENLRAKIGDEHYTAYLKMSENEKSLIRQHYLYSIYEPDITDPRGDDRQEIEE